MNRLNQEPFVFNQDCNDVNAAAPPGQAQEWIRDWYRRAFAAGAGVLVADVALPDVVEIKDAPTGEICGARFGVETQDKIVVDPHSACGPLNRIVWYRTIAELMAQGTDVLHMACEEGRKAGAIVLGGMRMSDAHHGSAWQAESEVPLFARFIMDHPEWCNTWDGDEKIRSVCGRLDATLNYAVPEVQAHRLQILREMATHYDIDGLELNWMRWCRHFPAGRQREHLNDLTRFVQQVRAMLDEVGQAKGVERMILGHRVPVTMEEALDIGCDVETWARRGCADYLAPMDFLFNDLNMRTEELVDAVRGTECLVYPGFGSTQYGFGYVDKAGTALTMRSLDQFRATAANWYAWGGAGGSAFNMYMWPLEHQEFYGRVAAILSDPKQAFAGPRHYVYLPVWKSHGGVGPTGRHNAQVLTFGADSVGRRQSFTFRTADGKNDEKADGVLRFRIYDATLEDRFAIDLNGTPVPPGKFTIEHQPQGEAFDEPEGPVCLPGQSFVWPANLCFRIAIANCPPFRGDNELGVTLVKRDPAGGKDPVMEALEVRVR